MKRVSAFLLKASLSLGLLAFLLVKAGLPAVAAVLCRVRWPELALALGTVNLALLLSCRKWQVLLRAAGVGCPLGSLVRYYLIGIYFNNFLPTSIGGDGVRIYYIARYSGNRAASLSSVVAERASGLLALLFLCLAGLSIAPQVAGPEGATVVLGASGVALLFLALAICAKCRIRLQFILPAAWREGFDGVLHGVGRYFASGRTLWAMAWTSLLYQLLVVLVYFFAAQALRIHLDFADLLFAVPVVTLLTLVPVSLNGMGIREAGFVYFFARIGIPEAQAVSLSLIVYAMTLLLSLLGLAFFVRGRSKSLDA